MELTSHGPAETEALGERLGRLLVGGELVCLIGGLGAGKTVFVRGLARALGCPPESVASPTYVIERFYPGRLELRHLDAHRLSGGDEFEEADLAAGLTSPGRVSVLEWADRVEAALPSERLEVLFEVEGASRRQVQLRACGGGYRALVKRLEAMDSAG